MYILSINNSTFKYQVTNINKVLHVPRLINVVNATSINKILQLICKLIQLSFVDQPSNQIPINSARIITVFE